MKSRGNLFRLLLNIIVGAILTVAVPPKVFAEYPPLPEIQLEKKVQGEEAIDALGEKLPTVAAHYGMSVQQLKEILRKDRTAWIDERGSLFYKESFPTRKKSSE